MNEHASEAALPHASVPGLGDFLPLSTAETKIVANLRSGDFDRLGDGLRPDWDDPARTVRAELLRFLILGSDHGFPMHEKGLSVSGARVTGILDLEGCRIPRDIRLKDCLFEASPVLRSPSSTICFSTVRHCPACRPIGSKPVAVSLCEARP